MVPHKWDIESIVFKYNRMYIMHFLLSRGQKFIIFKKTGYSKLVMYYNMKCKSVTKMVPGEKMLSLSSR